MSCWRKVWLFLITLDAAKVILLNFEALILNRLRMSFDVKVWQTLHNTASNCTVWPLLVNGDHVWSRIWNMNHFLQIEAEVRFLGLRCQVMACMARWGNIEQIWPKVAYNSTIYVLVARYDKFWPYQCLHYQFSSISTLSGWFDHITNMKPSKGKLAKNGMSIYGRIWSSAGHSVQFWRIDSESAMYVFRRQ